MHTSRITMSKIIESIEMYLIFASTLILISCDFSAPLSEQINARWQKNEENGQPASTKMWVEFFPDGSVVTNMTGSTDYDENIQGTYSLSKDNRIRIEFNILNTKSITMVGEASIRDNGDLVLKLGDRSTAWSKIR